MAQTRYQALDLFFTPKEGSRLLCDESPNAWIWTTNRLVWRSSIIWKILNQDLPSLQRCLYFADLLACFVDTISDDERNIRVAKLFLLTQQVRQITAVG